MAEVEEPREQVSAFPSRRSPGFPTGRALRPSAKVLPEHARGHNRSLVLQLLYRAGTQSRADVARGTGLTRVTVSDLIAELMSEGLVIETGERESPRPGKPGTLLDINRSAFHIVGVDLSAFAVFRGAILDLDGRIITSAEIPLANSVGADASDKVLALVDELVAGATAPLLGIGVGSPGVVDREGVILSAPNLGWTGLPLQDMLAERFSLPTFVINDANAAVLAEHSFGDANGDIMLVKIGHGVGAGLLVGGSPLYGSRYAAGEIGHVVVGTDGGAECSCGKYGCLETWLATPRLDARLERARTSADREDILRQAGHRLGIALAPVVGALDLAEIVLSGPVELLDGPLSQATLDTLRSRTMEEFHGHVVLRMTELGDDIVLRGAAVAVLSSQLGFS
ncbi:ROK family transcriptional regulator [Glaciihabitans sp. dw_435]|uniref:ROK family transcriptional regulator n=1 Tax=Glaciihabitans sp. dw_435 TaxID=2720081 RepID=UPI001BD67C5E|nr:ROK family transcriptional regulator [Glaciihabitans sp. dw_435]